MQGYSSIIDYLKAVSEFFVPLLLITAIIFYFFSICSLMAKYWYFEKYIPAKNVSMKLKNKLPNCNNCEIEIEKEDIFCFNCGKQVKKKEYKLDYIGM